MTRLIASIALASLAAAPAHAQWEPPDEVLQVRIQGEGPWHVRCAWQDRRDRAQTREMTGRRDRWERLNVLRPESGNCTYRAAPDKPLTIRLSSPLYSCTLPAPGESCQQTFPAGSSGQIEIRKRG